MSSKNGKERGIFSYKFSTGLYDKPIYLFPIFLNCVLILCLWVSNFQYSDMQNFSRAFKVIGLVVKSSVAKEKRV